APLRIHHLRRLQPFDEKADAAVDFAQAPLAVEIVGVLGSIAERGRPGHRLYHFGAGGLRQLFELGLQACVAFWRNVILARRKRWRRAFRLLRDAFVLDKGLRHGRSEERRVGKACRAWRWRYRGKKRTLVW